MVPTDEKVLLMPETCTVKIQERRPTLQPGDVNKAGVMVLRGRPDEIKEIEQLKQIPEHFGERNVSAQLESNAVSFDHRAPYPLKHTYGETTPSDSKESLNTRFFRQTQEMLDKMPASSHAGSNELVTIPQSTSRERIKIQLLAASVIGAALK